MASPVRDVEKIGGLKSAEITLTTESASSSYPPEAKLEPPLQSSAVRDIAPTPVLLKGKMGAWNEKIEGLAGLEARGIARVLPEEKHVGSTRHYIQMWSLWFSINAVASNIITGLLGPLVFSLGWVDCVCIVIFATALASAFPSYIATFGPESGNRTMILGRYFFGYWPSKLICILNIINQLGWGITGCIIAGQMLSAVNGAGLSIALGCIITAICIGVVAAFGIRWVHLLERYAFIPQMVVLFVLIGNAHKDFDTSAQSVGSSGTVTANRCSFFVLVFGSVVGFAAISADFYVYYPINTPKWITFTSTWSGMWMALICWYLVGVGIATGVAKNQNWSDAYAISSGALLLECYRGLGGFGGFCVVILALGSVTNNAPCAYSVAFCIQCLGRYGKAIPRWMWCIMVMIVELVCSVAGRDHLFNIFENFLPLMSYWASPWVLIALEEHILFRKLKGVKFDWEGWEDKKVLPIGAAALFAFFCGWAGAIVGMEQAWWQGPLALKVGHYGGDIGTWLSMGFAGIIFPPLRYLEMRIVGR